MKKGIVALLVVLALVVLISPGIVGRLAERSVDENLDWATGESDELVVTSQGFDRGWFSSEGQHRIEVQDGNFRAALLELTGNQDTGSLPALIIDTRLDHGLVPFSSMTRAGGTLNPGLGSAMSTLSIELADGELMPVPGTIYSNVRLNGKLESNYVLESGNYAADDGYFEWGDVNVHLTSDPTTGGVAFNGVVDTFAVSSARKTVRLGAIEFAGDQSPSPFGFSVGDFNVVFHSMAIASPDSPGIEFGRMSINGASEVNGDRVGGRASWQLDRSNVPGFGEIGVMATVAIQDIDGEALGALDKALRDLPASNDAALTLSTVETDLQRVLAAGLRLDFEQLDILLPQGTVAAKLSISIDATDPDDFHWTSLLLALDASADLQVPVELVDLAMTTHPQAGAVVAMGFLKQNGDVYEMEAAYKKGLLTVNGAPMPIPLPAVQ